MNEAEKRIVETLAHVKDASAVLGHVDLKPTNPQEAGVHAEIIAADASLTTAIDSLKKLQEIASDSGDTSANPADESAN